MDRRSATDRVTRAVRPGWRWLGLVALAAAVTLAACSSSGASGPPTTHSTQATTTSTTGVPPGTPDAAGTVWLCKPGLPNNPCTDDLTATAVRADGRQHVERAYDAHNPPIDCFYVYPTVSPQTTPNANLEIQSEEIDVAMAQASRFSQVCRVYAPMYPQLTVSSLGGKINASAAATAFLGVLSAWKDYLANYNHGRGVVLIGHSQGAALLVPLIRSQIDSSPAERRLLVSALLMGGNVTVPVGKTVGGSFQNVPACTADHQTGCVVAYSTFNTTPPATSLFGRTTAAGQQVLCTNPAALAGGTATLSPYFPTSSVAGARGQLPSSAPSGISTPWVTYPDLYTGTCTYADGASWLQVSTIPHSGDTRPVVTDSLGPNWGLHLVDVNIDLGNLVRLVGDQSRAYTH